LPEIVQFRNGNQIKYLYDARGQKLKVDYFTCLKVIDPIQETQVGNWTYTPNEIDKFSNVFIGNMMYRLSNTVGLPDNPQLIKIENPEGYSSSGGQKWYYRRDHLGTVHEVWWQYRNLTMQSTQYYPSGLPWSEGTGVGTQLNKYNGKLWDEMHGWETYDYGARGYYPAMGGFMSVDPLAEKYYDISPYAYCHNNPVNRIDPDGRGDENTGGKRSEINPMNGVPTAAQSATSGNEPKEKIKSTPIKQLTPLQAAAKKAQSQPLGKIVQDASKYEKAYYATTTPTDRALSQSPVIRAVATGGLAVMVAIATPVVGLEVKSAVTAIQTTGNFAVDALSASTKAAAFAGAGEGFLKALSPSSINMPPDVYFLTNPVSQVSSDISGGITTIIKNTLENK